MITGTYDGTTVRVYLDGLEVGTGTEGIGAIDYTSPTELVFGAYTTAGDYSFVYLPDSAITLGETLAIPYGTMGGKSGPFYSMELEGDALSPVGDGEETFYIIDPEGWAVEKSVLVKTLRADRPGRSRVKIFVKRHFLQSRELEREFDIHVTPGTGR